MLGCFLFVLIALSTGSVILELRSTIYEFSLIFTVFVAFWKKLFSSCDTTLFCSLSSKIILFANLVFSEKIGWIFFQKTLLSVIVLTRRVTRGERGEGLPCPFSKFGKKYPNFGKKCPDCGHLWVKFLI